MLYALRDLLPRDKPWHLGAVAGVFGLLSFVFQALPLGVLLDLDGKQALQILFAVPALAALVAGGVAFSHNRRLGSDGAISRPSRKAS